LTGSLGGTTAAGDATASIIEDSTEIALGIPNVRIGDADIGSDIGTDAVEGWNRGNRTDGDDEDAQQSGELHLGEYCGKKVIYKEVVMYLKSESNESLGI
jgi:hypothetical protein